jgi:DNA-binding NtrC family response regulator
LIGVSVIFEKWPCGPLMETLMRRMSSLLDFFALPPSYPAAGKGRVLIVEDDWLIALALHDMVQEMGYEPLGPAGDLPTALHLARGGGFDAAILDYWLHDRTAQDVAHVLTGAGIPFALTTGFGAAVLGKDHKAACVLSKPYTREDIADVLAQLMPQHASLPLRHAAAPALP